MRDSLKAFVAVLKDRRKGVTNSIRSLEDQRAHGATALLIAQAHLNELDYVIQELEQIVDED